MIVDTDLLNFKYIKIKTKPISLDAEIERYKQYSLIVKKVIRIFIKHKIKPKKNTLQNNVYKIISRFIISNLSVKKIKNLQDGLFHNYKSDESFRNDIKSIFIINDDKCDKLVKQINICKLFNRATRAIQSTKPTNATNDYKLEMDIGDEMIEYKLVGGIIQNLRIPVVVYEQLKNRYAEYCSVNKKDKFCQTNQLDNLVYILLLRYHTINSGAQQFGMPYSVRNKFQSIEFDFECFASTLNHYLKYYCSMFYDIEKYFMSLGPFQNIDYYRGRYMANPPYELDLLNGLVNKILYSIENSSLKDKSLTFMFGLPDWERFNVEFDFINNVKKSKYKKYELKLPPYKYPWHNFMSPGSVVRIPSSYRMILSNEELPLDLIHEYNLYWSAI